MPDLFAGLGALLNERAWFSLVEDDERIANEISSLVAKGATADEILRFTRRWTGSEKLSAWYYQAACHLAKLKPATI